MTVALVVAVAENGVIGRGNTLPWHLSADLRRFKALTVGHTVIIYLAGLQAISPELEEAATLEGAGRWHYFRRVVFPLLMPTTLFVLINAVINSFKLVDQLFIMTKGGPDNASSLLLYYIYQVAFSFLDESYAATLTVVLLAILAVLAIGQYFLLEKRIHYQ